MWRASGLRPYGGWCTSTPQGQRLSCAQTLPDLTLVSLHTALHLYLLSYTLINWQTYVLWAPWTSWLNPRRKSLDPLICSQIGWKLWVTWGPPAWDWSPSWGWEQSLGTEPLTCGIWKYFQADGTVIGSNCRIPSWCHRELLGVGQNLDTFGDQSEVACV